MLLYLIRHGDPIYNPDCLTDLGHKQAEALVPRLTPLGFDKIFVSPMIRAKQTAEPTCKALGMTPEVREFLSEHDLYMQMSCPLPDDSGAVRRRWCFHQPTVNYRTAESYHQTDDWHTLPPFRGIPTLKPAYDAFVLEADKFLAELGYVRSGDRYKIENPKYGRVAVFCHQGISITLLSHLLGIPPHIMWGCFDITHTGITVLNFPHYDSGETQPVCLCLSDTSHLFAGNLPLEYNGNIPF